MDISKDIRHSTSSPISDLTINDSRKLKWINLAALFIIQFLLSQLVLSYGMYTEYLVRNQIHIMDCIWPPVLYLTTSKLFNPVFRHLCEIYQESYFNYFLSIGTMICFSSIALCSPFHYSYTNIYGVLYGVFGGIGASLVFSLMTVHLSDIFPYQTHLVWGIQHLGIAIGLFVTPHFIHLIFDYFDTMFYTLLIHSALLLHILPAGLFLGKKKSTKQRVTAYNNLGSVDAYGEEMVEMSRNPSNRCWKSPADTKYSEEYINIDETDDTDSEKISSPVLQHKLNSMNVTIMPQIIEEDEIDSDDENLNSKRSSILLNDNLKRMSVISTKLEELIVRDEDIIETNETKQNQETNNNHEHIIDEDIYNNITVAIKKDSCLKRFKNRLKYIFNVTLKPMFRCFKIIEFYPALFSNIHALLSPLIFFNFVAFSTSYNTSGIHLTELAFMFSIIAFAYLIFLIILPWVSEISKRNLKFLYICGCFISACGVYVFSRTENDDYIIVSCLIYGFGLGIESYLKEIVVKEALGVTKWSKTENTLECLSGIIFFFIIIGLKNMNALEIDLKQICLKVILITHLLVSFSWITLSIIKTIIFKYSSHERVCGSR